MRHALNSRYVITTLSLLILISAVIVFASKQSQQETQVYSADIRVENKTKALKIESLNEIRKQKQRTNSTSRDEARTFEVKLKNDSAKPIASYSLVIKDASSNKDSRSAIERGGMTDEWALMPNETDINRFSAASKGETVLTVGAVLFDDGIGEGEPGELARLRDNRAGIKLAYEQIVLLLRKRLNENENVGSDSVMQFLEKEIASLNDEKVPMNQKAGFRQAKDFFITEMKDLTDQIGSASNVAYQSKIAEQISRIERVIARF